MATYTFRCKNCGNNVPVDAPLGEAPDVAECNGCGAQAVRVYGSFHIGAGALPNKRAGVMAMDAQDERVERDRIAYSSLRKEGIQPAGINGAHELSGAKTQFEIEYGKQYPDPKDQAKVRQGLDMAAQIREDAGVSEGQAWVRPPGRS